MMNYHCLKVFGTRIRRIGKHSSVACRLCLRRPISWRGVIVQELCESRGGRPGLAVLTSLLSGFRGRKAILNHASALVSACP